MKRSEMIDAIYQHLLWVNSPYHKGYNVIKNPKLLDVADGILRQIEESGMLPPEIPVNRRDFIGESHGYYTYQEYQIEFGVRSDEDLEAYQWESEDEA